MCRRVDAKVCFAQPHCTMRRRGSIAPCLRGGQTFPKSTEIRNSVAFRAIFFRFFPSEFFRVAESVSHDVLTYWEANSG